jgi:hypothetical protein
MSTEQARLHAPQAFRERACCVTEADYAQVAERHPEVARAVARFRWIGGWRTAFIYVQRRGNHPLDGDLQRALRSYLERFRLAGCDLEVRGARLVPLEIELDVYLEPGRRADAVRANLGRAFGDARAPGGRRGFFRADTWTFGQALHQSQVIARAMAVPGVARAEIGVFRRMGADQDSDPIAVGPLEIIQVRNDPANPLLGAIKFTLR